MDIDRFVQRSKSLGNKSSWINLKEGDNYLRFVQVVGDEDPWRETARHFLRDFTVPDDFNKAPVCIGDGCPGCFLVEELRKRGDSAKADKVKAQPRFLMATFYRDVPNDETGQLCIKIYEMPPTVFQKLGKLLEDWGQSFTDSVTGYDIKITKIPGTGGGFMKYEVAPVTRKERGTMSLVVSPLTEDELLLIDDAFPDLDAEIVPPQIEMYESVVAGLLESEPRTGLGKVARPPIIGLPKAYKPATEPEVLCPKFGEFDETVDECLGCDEAEACKEEAEKKQVAQLPTPRRTPKRTQ